METISPISKNTITKTKTAKQLAQISRRCSSKSSQPTSPKMQHSVPSPTMCSPSLRVCPWCGFSYTLRSIYFQAVATSSRRSTWVLIPLCSTESHQFLWVHGWPSQPIPRYRHRSLLISNRVVHTSSSIWAGSDKKNRELGSQVSKKNSKHPLPHNRESTEWTSDGSMHQRHLLW